MESDRELFLKEAFFLYSMRDRILRDNRLYMTPVPVQNGLAYSGPFKPPVLGVYAEWWSLNAASRVTDAKGELQGLVYRLSRSPLSGCNACGLVLADGSTRTYTAPSFIALWRDFLVYNQRAQVLKGHFEAFTLPEAVALLKDPHDPRQRVIQLDSRV